MLKNREKIFTCKQSSIKPRQIKISINGKHQHLLTDRSKYAQLSQVLFPKRLEQKHQLHKTFQLPLLQKRTTQYLSANLIKESLNQNKQIEQTQRRILKILEEKYDISIKNDGVRVIQSYIIYAKFLFKIVQSAKCQILQQLGHPKRTIKMNLKSDCSSPVLKDSSKVRIKEKQNLKKNKIIKILQQQLGNRFESKIKLISQQKNRDHILSRKHGINILQQNKKIAISNTNSLEKYEKKDQVQTLQQSRMISSDKQGHIHTTHYRLYCVQKYFELQQYNPEHIVETVAKQVMRFFLGQKIQRKEAMQSKSGMSTIFGYVATAKNSQKRIPIRVQDRPKNRRNALSDENDLYHLIIQLGNIIKGQSTETRRLLEVMSSIRQKLASTLKRLRCRRGTWMINANEL